MHQILAERRVPERKASANAGASVDGSPRLFSRSSRTCGSDLRKASNVVMPLSASTLTPAKSIRQFEAEDYADESATDFSRQCGQFAAVQMESCPMHERSPIGACDQRMSRGVYPCTRRAYSSSAVRMAPSRFSSKMSTRPVMLGVRLEPCVSDWGTHT